MFSLNGTLKKSGSVGRWETKQFIGMALLTLRLFDIFISNNTHRLLAVSTTSCRYRAQNRPLHDGRNMMGNQGKNYSE